MDPEVRTRHYDSTRARDLYFKEHDIYNKAGRGNYAKWFCENPDCKTIQFLSDLDIHHLLPRRLVPSLVYDTSNMILLCKKCHQEIEGNKQKKEKVPFPYPEQTYCYFCGYELDYRRDRIGDDSFHQDCMLDFLESPHLPQYIIKKREQNDS